MDDQIKLTLFNDVIAFIEYLAVVIALLMVAVTGICAVAITRPGAQALVSAFMAYAGFSARKDPPKAPAQPAPLATAQSRIIPGTALKLHTGD
jgi:hypothetical protein